MRSEEEIEERLSEIDTNLSTNNLIIFTILKWVLEGNQWISVDDRLPENQQEVVFVAIEIGVFNDYESKFAGYYDGYFFAYSTKQPKLDSAICWMPLPKTPQGK